MIRLIPLILAVLILCVFPSGVHAQDRSAEQRAVQRIGKSLGKKSGRQYPWYSPSRDESQFVPFPKERKQRPPEKDWNFGDLSFMAFVLYILGGVFLVLILWLVIWFLMKRFSDLHGLTFEGQKEKREHKRRLETLPPEARGEVGNLLGAAEKAFENGDYRTAIILYFSFQIWELDKFGFIRLHPGKTNHEYLGELGRFGELRVLYEQTMLLFEKTYFGERSLSRDELEPIWSNRTYFLESLTKKPQDRASHSLVNSLR